MRYFRSTQISPFRGVTKNPSRHIISSSEWSKYMRTSPKYKQLPKNSDLRLINFGFVYLLSMNIRFFLFTLLTLVASQILAQHSNTLRGRAETASTLDSLQASAINYLLEVHPELANFTLTKIRTFIDRSSQAYATNLIDYLFQLDFQNRTVRALVTVSTERKQISVSLSPLVSSSPASQKSNSNIFAEYSILLDSLNKDSRVISDFESNQKIVSNNEANIIPADAKRRHPHPNKLPLNSFIEYKDQSDPLVQFALDYVAGKRPNLINYQIESISYQLIAGLNIRIQYSGDDNFTTAVAIVSFDIKLRPQLFRFEVGCAVEDSSCSPSAAASIYQSIESILIFHPQLFAYRIANFLLKQNTGDKIRAMITFQNKDKEVRTLIEQEVTNNRVSILSLYSYSYKQ